MVINKIKWDYLFSLKICSIFLINGFLTTSSSPKTTVPTSSKSLNLLMIKFIHNNNLRFRRDILILSEFANIPNIYKLENDINNNIYKIILMNINRLRMM